MPQRPSPAVASMTLLAGAAIAVAGSAVGSAAAPTDATRVVTVEDGTVESTVSGRGTLAPAADAEVDFKTTGRIEKVYVEEGDHVSKGQLLARLDDTAQRAALKSAQAALAAASSASGGGASGSFSGGRREHRLAELRRRRARRPRPPRHRRPARG